MTNLQKFIAAARIEEEHQQSRTLASALDMLEVLRESLQFYAEGSHFDWPDCAPYGTVADHGEKAEESLSRVEQIARGCHPAAGVTTSRGHLLPHPVKRILHKPPLSR